MVITSLLFTLMSSNPSFAKPPVGASPEVACAVALKLGAGKFTVPRAKIANAIEHLKPIHREHITELRQYLDDPRNHALALRFAGEDAESFLNTFANELKEHESLALNALAASNANRPTLKTHYRRFVGLTGGSLVGLTAVLGGMTFAPEWFLSDAHPVVTQVAAAVAVAAQTAYLSSVAYLFYRAVIDDRAPALRDAKDVNGIAQLDEDIRTYREREFVYHRLAPKHGPFRSRHLRFDAVLSRDLIANVETTGEVSPDLIVRSVNANHAWLEFNPPFRRTRLVTVDLMWNSTGFDEPEVIMVVRLKGERRQRFTKSVD